MRPTTKITILNWRLAFLQHHLPFAPPTFGRKAHQEVHEERSVEVLGELVEHEPVSAAALAHVVVDLVHVGVPLEVPVHAEAQKMEPEPGRVDLHQPEDQAKDAEEGEDEEPPPDDQENLKSMESKLSKISKLRSLELLQLIRRPISTSYFIEGVLHISSDLDLERLPAIAIAEP